MKFLMEHHVAFDTQILGFPSIKGCLAIVYQTSAGLYGFHNAGGSAQEDWKPRATLFAQFVRQHGGLALPATRLYGVSFVSNNRRGYSGGSQTAKAKWKEELVIFATELGFTGRISGYDLTKSFPGQTSTGEEYSAYVEYRVNQKKCDVYIREWGEHEGTVPTVNPAPTEHMARTGHRTNPSLAALANVPAPVPRTNLLHIHKEKLR